MVAIARALTPTEVITSWEAGPDFVKVVWCAQNCGERYILALSLLDSLKAGREHLAARKAKAMIPEEE
jgi:2-keto-3-deoxy-6-phosphogluconate aldolase